MLTPCFRLSKICVDFSAIADGSYSVSRPLYFYVKNAHLDVIPGMREYVNEFMSNSATGDDKPFTLTLQTGETDIAADDVIGSIRFQAPDEGTGTDAILVAAAIQARSEGDFSSSSNATSIDFMTGSSEVAAKKWTIKSDGKVTQSLELTWKNCCKVIKDLGNQFNNFENRGIYFKNLIMKKFKRS